MNAVFFGAPMEHRRPPQIGSLTCTQVGYREKVGAVFKNVQHPYIKALSPLQLFLSGTIFLKIKGLVFLLEIAVSDAAFIFPHILRNQEAKIGTIFRKNFCILFLPNMKNAHLYGCASLG